MMIIIAPSQPTNKMNFSPRRPFHVGKLSFAEGSAMTRRVRGIVAFFVSETVKLSSGQAYKVGLAGDAFSVRRPCDSMNGRLVANDARWRLGGK